MAYLSGKTDCTKGNTFIRVNTAVTVQGTGATVTQWRINGGVWTSSSDFGPYGRDSILVEVLAYDNTQNGCIISKKILVDEKTPIDITALALSQDKDCTLNNAKISTQATGSNTPFQYKLGSGSFSTNAVFSNLGSGLYLVTAKDASNCQDTMSVRITEPPLLQITGTTKTNETDCTASNAQVTVNTSGTRGSVTYKVNNGNPLFSNVIPNLSTGTYTISVLDAAGCTASTNVSINEPAQLALSLAKQQEHDCIPGNTRIVATATGAQGTLSYKLDGGTAQSGNIFNFVPNGPHTVSVQDATSGCVVSNTIVIGEDAQLSATTAVQNVLCSGGNNGAVTISVSGGSTPYTFNWSNYGSTTNTIQNLPIGNYSVTVSDARACQVIKTVTVDQPGGIGYGANPTYKDITCYGGNDGSILLQPFTGGTAPYSFSWSNGATTSSLTNLSAGAYSLTVTDAVGCQKVVVSSSLGQPQPLAINSTSQYTNHLDCIANNTAITLTASGGRGAYTYRLNGGTAQTSGTFTGKTTGTYQILVKDTANCTKEFTVNVTEKLPPPVITIDTVRVCAGTSAIVTINGAPGSGMQYSWTVPIGASNPGNVAQFNTLIAGTYSVTMTETATSCSRTASGVVVHKALPTANAGTAQNICVGSSATLSGTANGGTSPYTYGWSNGANTSTSSVSPSVTTTYTLTVTDNKGCVNTSQVTVVINSLPTASIQNNNGPICSGSTASFNVTGTTGAVLTYRINSGTDQTLTLTGNTQTIQVANATTNQTLTLVSVSTTGTSGCTNNLNTSSTVVLNPVLVANAGSNKFTCPLIGTELNGSASGGTAPYTYAWDNFGNYVNNQRIGVVLENTTTYTLTVTDSKGCKASSQVIVNVYPALITSAGANQTICRGQNVTLTGTAIGGTGIHTYAWNGGATTNSITVNPIVSTTYTLTVTDLYGCTGTSSVSVTVAPLPSVQLKAADTLRCDQTQVTLSPLTAANDLQLKWKNGQGTVLTTTRQIQVRSAGIYVLEVTDALGCKNSDTTQVITYIPQIARIDTFPSTHCDSANARIRVQLVNPGAWLYRIDSTEWNTSATFSGLLMGTYAISIASPDTSCIIDTTITIGSRETCIDICAGDSILIGKPGLNPWCMKWLPEDGLSNPDSSYTWVKPTNSTIYRLIITDDEGNILDSLMYRVTLCSQLSVSPDTLNLCEHKNPVLIASGGNGVYEWKDGNGNTVGTGSTFSPTEPGIYTVVQVSGGATQTVTAQVIKEIADTDLQIEPAYAVLCSDSLILTAPAGYHSLLWKNGQDSILSTASELIVRQPGLYKLEAEIGLSCTGQASVTITTAPFSITLDQLTDTVDVFDYQKATDFYNNLSGTGRQVLGLLNPEGKNVIVTIDKGCYDCGAVTVEVRDTILPDSTNCQKTVRRAWIARNECGRRSVAIQTLIVNDQKPPHFIDFPADSLIVTCGLPMPDETPRAADNGGRKVQVSLHNVEKITRGSCDTLLIRHWRALDSCGNDSIRKQYLLIKASAEGLLGVGNPHACGTPYQQPQLNQNLRQTLQAEDVIWIYGFPVKIWNVTGGAGTFSGNGLLTLPFQEQAVKVTFANIQVNEDGKVLAGTMQAVRAPNQVTYRCADPEEVDFCPTYTTRKDSLAAIARQEANGFKNCLWDGASPVAGLEIDKTYDPYGFDCKGIHRTGKTTNEIGCTQSEMNDSKNDKCFGKIEPWAWLTPKDTLGVITDEGGKLAEQIKDSLRLIVSDILADLILEWETEHRIQQIKCAGIRSETRNAFAALGLPDSTYVFGSEGQYVKEGMWRQFAGAPSVLSLSVSREAGMETLEKKHVELYPCDKKQEELKTRLTEAGGLQNEEDKGKLIQWLTDMIRRLPKDSVVAFQQNRELFKAWVKRQIATRAAQNAQAAFTNTDTPGSTSGGFHQVPAPSRGAMHEEKENIDAAIAEWQQRLSAQAKARQVRINQALVSGEEFIEGTHRAFYLQDIARQKSASFFPPDGNAKDTGAVLLPIAITKPVGGRNYTILLDNISINANTGGTLNAYLILPAPSGVGKDSVVFQALNIPFTPGGANYNNAKLTLKCEAPMRLSDIAQLKLLAGNQTYIEWDCNGFSKLNLAAEIEFCRNVLVPYDGESLQPAPDSVRLKATLSTYITAWDDFTMGVNFSHPFGLSEEGGFLFRVNDAYIDMSSTKTPADLKFPENYPFANAGDRNLWKGFYMKQFSIYLPQELDQSRAPRGISLTDMIIDDAGVSVVASIPGPVVPLQDGNLDGWAFSIDSVLIKVLKNKFSGAGFGGLVNIPILSSATGNAISPEDCVRYTAMIEDQGRYTFSVQPATGKKIGMWFADVNIAKSSKVSVTYANRRFEAKAVLNGTIKVNVGGGTDTTGTKIKIPELRFQDLTVSNTAPYFNPGVWDRPTTSVGVKASFDGFNLGVDSVSVDGGTNPGLGFRVHLGIDAANGSLAVEGGFKMKGRLDVSTGRQRWLPDGLDVKRFSIDGSIKEVFKVSGFVEHFQNKPKFGNGFWGGLNAELSFLGSGAGIKAVALFGTTNTPDSTKYFMIDAMGILPDGAGGPGLAIKGFGGGAWNRMIAQDTAIVLKAIDGDITQFPVGQSLSGVKYEPSASAGLGLKAALALATSDGKAFNGLVTLSAQFKAGGALDDITLAGLGTMLKEVKYESGGQPDSANASIRVGVRLKYSFSQKALDGLLQVNMVVPNALTASGEAKIHFSDKKWFIHVGTPQNPVRANFQIPLVGNIGAARLYLDMGSELPPPAALPSYFRDMGITSAIMDSRAGSGGGGGVMFGVGLDLKANFDKLKPLYASMNINLGADLALIDYGNAICSTTGQQIGINGWYATGQVYAYLRASVGLKFKDKQFPIAELAVGAALQGKLPNPTFARGAVGGSYRILGGLVKGKFNLQFTLGKDCGELEGGDGTEQSLEQNYQIIAALRPNEGAIGVVTTSVPAADFRFPINSTLESFDDNGNPISYLVELDGTPQLIETVTQAAVPARAILSADGRSLRFQPYDALKDSTRFSFIVKVKYSKNGTVIGRQEKQVTFTTGAAAVNISSANISASYPISGMQHFYPGEYAAEGEFIELRQGQADLFKGSNAPKAILLGATGGQLWQGAVQYNLASKRVSFNFPNEILRPGQCYTLEIRRLAQPETRANDNNGGTSLPPGLLTTLNFCTSNYQTFREKATAFAQGATRTVVGNQIVLTGSTEEFDELETGAGSGSDGFVALETSLYNNQWYQTQKELLYKAYRSKWGDGAFQFVPRARNGAAPDQAVAWGGGKVLQFNVLMELLADFQDFRNQVRDYDAELRSKCSAGQTIGYASASPCSNCCILPEFLPALLELNAPAPPASTYPIRLSYSIPGMAAGSSTTISVYNGTTNPDLWNKGLK